MTRPPSAIPKYIREPTTTTVKSRCGYDASGSGYPLIRPRWIASRIAWTLWVARLAWMSRKPAHPSPSVRQGNDPLAAGSGPVDSGRPSIGRDPDPVPDHPRAGARLARNDTPFSRQEQGRPVAQPWLRSPVVRAAVKLVAIEIQGGEI